MNPANVPFAPPRRLLPDPGNGGTIALDGLQSIICGITSAGAETRILQAPSKIGQEATLYCDTYVGNIVITINNPVSGLTTITLTAVSITAQVIAVGVAGVPAWKQLAV